MISTITKGEYKDNPIPDNVYLAKLLNVKEKQPPTTHPDWAVTLGWSFEILVEPYKKRRAFGRTPSSWISGKKLDAWLVTLGINVAKGTSLKLEDLKEIPCKILVKNKKYQDKETGEDKYFPEVKELLALDSLDQIKIRELMTAPVMTPTNIVSHQQPVAVQIPVSQTTTGFVVPGTISAPIPTFNPTTGGTAPVAPATTPSVGGPTRAIPF